MMAPLEMRSDDPQIIALQEEVALLREIIDVFLGPDYEMLNSDDENTRSEYKQAIIRKRELQRDHHNQFDDLAAKVAELEKSPSSRILSRKLEARLEITDKILLSRHNTAVSFSEMGKLQEFPQKSRRQNMTHLGHVYEQFPERYTVVDSQLQGRNVLLNPIYYKNLVKERSQNVYL